MLLLRRILLLVFSPTPAGWWGAFRRPCGNAGQVSNSGCPQLSLHYYFWVLSFPLIRGVEPNRCFGCLPERFPSLQTPRLQIPNHQYPPFLGLPKAPSSSYKSGATHRLQHAPTGIAFGRAGGPPTPTQPKKSDEPCASQRIA